MLELIPDFGVKLKNRYFNLKTIFIKLIYSLVFATLIAISANTFFYLPMTPVPITLQTLTVIFTSIILGKNLALLSTSIYIIAGILGLPVFADFKTGFLTLLGPTGGYIIGFIFASYFTACFFEIFSNKNKLERYSVLASSIIGILIIYFFGYLHFLGFLYPINKFAVTNNIFYQAYNMAIKPFIIPDILKMLMLSNFKLIYRKNF